MAEILGAAASVAGLVSLAIQLADSATKLKRFCYAVQDAPAHLQHIVFEVETLSLMLQRVEVDRQNHPHLDSTIVVRCLTMCQEATQRISGIADALDKSMRRGSRLGAIKTAFRQGDIDRYYVGLERAKSTLLLAFQLYDSEVQRQTLSKIHLAVTGISQPTGKVSDVHDQSLQSNSISRRARPRKTRASDSQRAYTIRLPFLKTAWAFAASRATSGWDWKLRTYNIRPDDSEIFQACENGDVNSIRELFAAGQASVFDVNEDSDSLLFYAALSPRPLEVCRLLLEWGIEPCLSRIAPSIACLVRSESGLLDMYKLFIGEYGADVPFPHEEEDHASRYWYVSAPAVLIGWVQATLCVSYTAVPLQQRLENALSLARTASVQAFLTALGCTGLDRSLVRMKGQTNRTVLHAAAHAFAYYSRRYPTHNQHLQQWHSLCREIIQLGADLHALTDDIDRMQGRSFTPMAGFISQYDSHVTDRLIADGSDPFMLQVWIKLLLAAEVDLASYGEREAAIRASAGPYIIHDVKREGRHQCYRVLGFSYGPQPSDWRLKICRLLHVGLFKQRVIPGAWVHDWDLSIRPCVMSDGLYGREFMKVLLDNEWRDLEHLDENRWELVKQFEVTAPTFMERFYPLGDLGRERAGSKPTGSEDDLVATSFQGRRRRLEHKDVETRSKSTQRTSFTRAPRGLCVSRDPEWWVDRRLSVDRLKKNLAREDYLGN